MTFIHEYALHLARQDQERKGKPNSKSDWKDVHFLQADFQLMNLISQYIYEEACEQQTYVAGFFWQKKYLEKNCYWSALIGEKSLFCFSPYLKHIKSVFKMLTS